MIIATKHYAREIPLIAKRKDDLDYMSRYLGNVCKKSPEAQRLKAIIDRGLRRYSEALSVLGRRKIALKIAQRILDENKNGQSFCYLNKGQNNETKQK